MAFGNVRVEECPVTMANRAVVTIDPALKEALLVALYGWKDEFILFLEGVRDERSAHITGIHVPEQYNAPTTCEAIEKFDPDKWLGIMHSHVAMGAFHSCTDEKGVDNAPVSLVISRRNGDAEICGKMGVVLPCGSNGILKTIVTFGEREASPTEWLTPVNYTLQDAMKSDCPHAYKNKAAAESCTSFTMVQRDFVLFNQIQERTKTRSYVSTYKGGPASAQSSKSTSADKKSSVTSSEPESARTGTTGKKQSAKNPVKGGESTSAIDPKVEISYFRGEIAYGVCDWCDEVMEAAYLQPDDDIKGFQMCNWCIDFKTQYGRYPMYRQGVVGM